MKIRLLSLLLCLLMLPGLGCTSNSSQTSSVRPDANVLGIVKVYEGSYKPVGPTTLPLSTGEVTAGEKLSGNRVELLWGLITLTDY